MERVNIVEELERIRKRNKGKVLMPEEVVEAARPTGHPLHSRFQWDDTEAARQYRIWQARELIRVNVQIVTSPTSGKQIEVPVYISPASSRSSGGGYRLTMDLMLEEESSASILEEALGELNHWRKKYAALRELQPVFEAADSMAAK